MMAPKIAAYIKLSKIVQVTINTRIDGIVIMAAMIVPRSAISRIESLVCLSSGNS